MSVKPITLQPPPNVDFVHGYPGIPPGNNRPPAEVMGSVELRFPKDGLKTKWVKVVLRKVETLPGGVPASLTPDFIGQMPQTIWAAAGEYETIINKEFDFRLRLPETIPPSINLEKNAGIRYELVASVCVKGKRGLLRKSASTVLEDMQILPIDKHELHSTWPVYNQPDTRTESRDQLTLTVTRAKSCFSPGERVQIQAVLHSNSFTAAHLRAFDFALVETIHFHPGPKVKPSKKAGPLFKSTRIGEHRIPVNATLYGGMQHTADLSCVLSPDHINPTVNSARNIDVAYKVVVIAQVDNVKPYSLELPISISNWQRMASAELTAKIGHVPNLSLGPAPPAPKHTQRLSANDRTRRYDHMHPSVATHVTAAASLNTSVRANNSNLTEFGQPSTPKELKDTKSSTLPPQHGSPHNRPREKEKARPLTGNNSGSDTTNSTNAQTARLNVTNQNASDRTDGDATPGNSWISATEEKLRMKQLDAKNAVGATTTKNGPAPAHSPWLSAEDEKRRMFQEAQSRVNKTQNQTTASDQTPNASTGSSKESKQFLSAEEEKRRLFEDAQRRAANTQAAGASSGVINQKVTPAFGQTSGTHGTGRVQSPAPAPAPSTGAALYSHAMAAVNNAKYAAQVAAPASTPARLATPPATLPTNQPPRFPGISQSSSFYPTAEEEKAALRYAEAKRAVEANQAYTDIASSSKIPDDVPSTLTHGAPIPYDQLFPETSPHLNGHANDLARSSYTSSAALSELIRSRSPSDQDFTPAQSRVGSPLGSRRKMSLPAPPVPMSGVMRPLSVAEEKARLRAQYEAEDAAAALNGSRGSQLLQNPMLQHLNFEEPPPHSRDSTFLSRDPTIKQGKQRALNNNTPPPLLPKPPSNYIEETQAEDERIRTQLDEEDTSALLEDAGVTQVPYEFSLDIRPFSPFDIRLSNLTTLQETLEAVPPLPPKIPISH